MNINEKLNRAFDVVPMAKWDKRLATDSELKSQTTRLKRADVLPRLAWEAPTIPTKSNYKPNKVTLSDEHIRIIAEEMQTPEVSQEISEIPEEPTEETVPKVEVVPETEKTEPEYTPEVRTVPSGSGYSVEMARNQIEGILNNWSKMERAYPENSDKRVKFDTIKNILGEISDGLYKDFIEKQEERISEIPSGLPKEENLTI